jgi:hypothetical protein
MREQRVFAVMRVVKCRESVILDMMNRSEAENS